MKYHYNVYVIQLSHKVLNERKFLKSNPNYIQGKLCFYVGMTGLDPDIRFDKHKAGIQSNKYVKKYGYQLGTKEDIQSIRDTLYKLDKIDKPIKAMSAY